MKILVKIMGFGGGAPLSLLQYAKYWRDRGDEVCVLGEYCGAEVLFDKERIRTVNFPAFRKRKPIKNIHTLYLTSRYISVYKPDLLVWWTEDEAIFGSIISDKFSIPSAYVFAGGKMLSYITKVLNPRPVLVFSIENKTDLIKQGYCAERVHQISNRIEYKDDNIGYKKVLIKERNNAVLMSRVTDTLYGSITTVLDVVCKYAKTHQGFYLTILGKGSKENDLRLLVDKINKELGYKAIEYKGYVTDTSAYIDNAMIAFGRGRSVIEPIMHGLFGVVVDEDGRFCICNSKTYRNLVDNNFSGRNIDNLTTYADLEELLNSLENGSIDSSLNEYEEMRRHILQDYCIEYGYEKIDYYIDQVMSTINVKRHVLYLASTAKLYLTILLGRLSKKYN